jgi:hypothetical protein
MRYVILMLCMLMMPGCSVRSLLGLNEPQLPKAPTFFPTVNPNWADGLDALFLYSYAFCIIIIAACVAVLFWVQIPSLRKWAWIGLTFAASLIGMGITFSIVKPFIPWIVLGGLAFGVGIGVWYIIANFDTLRQFIHRDKEDLTLRAQNLVTACQNLPPPK